jgi:hypothetical protein
VTLDADPNERVGGCQRETLNVRPTDRGTRGESLTLCGIQGCRPIASEASVHRDHEERDGKSLFTDGGWEHNQEPSCQDESSTTRRLAPKTCRAPQMRKELSEATLSRSVRGPDRVSAPFAVSEISELRFTAF